MKNSFLFMSIILLVTVACGPTKKQNEEKKDSVTTLVDTTSIPVTANLKEVITEFAQAYVSQDQQKINTHINPELGLYIIYRPGAGDEYTHVDSINFKKPVPEHFPYGKISTTDLISFAKLPEFDCGTDRWSKLGFFCDTTKTPNQLSTIINFKKEFEPISSSEVSKIQTIEKDSYRVILTRGDNLIFHVKKYKDAWYVITLDRAYGWCDA
ncbi:hypothetical protein [Sphingobacterium sp. MYb382]|uniref:hypothetical protein n=1 Tax=Sphingobacterium sp. MYb382 TaxID=2745278 RepID=UPI00309C4BF3